MKLLINFLCQKSDCQPWCQFCTKIGKKTSRIGPPFHLRILGIVMNDGVRLESYGILIRWDDMIKIEKGFLNFVCQFS